MKAVIIGAGEEALHTIEKAHNLGIQIIALDGNPKAAGLSAADKGLVVDISNETETIRTVRKEQPDFVLTVPIGRYLTTIGAVNDALGLSGITGEMAVLCTDKYRFHEKLAARGLRNCHCYAVGTGDVDTGHANAAPEIEFPAILKPRYGSGSRGLHMVSNHQELAAALLQIEGEEYVLEDCVPGEEYGVDGAVIQGEFYMTLLRKKINTPPPHRQAVGYFARAPKDAFWQQTYDYMKKVIDCLGLRECLLHSDLIGAEMGPFVIELSARPSGHNLHNLFTPLCTGIDLAEEYIKYRLGRPFNFVPKHTKHMLIHYFDAPGRVAEVPNAMQIEQLLQKKQNNSEQIKLVCWHCNITAGEVLKPVSDGHSVMGRGYYILEGDNEEAMLELTAVITNSFF